MGVTIRHSTPLHATARHSTPQHATACHSTYDGGTSLNLREAVAMDNSSHVLRRIAVHMHACMRTWSSALVTSESLPLE